MKAADNHGCIRCKKPTCEAHLLPQGFTRRVRGKNKNIAQIFKDRVGEKLTQSSTYDDNIICSECDGKIGTLDDYALDFCKKFNSKKHLIETHFFLPNVSSDKLVRFAASIIWRSAISKRPETVKVDLGEETAAFEKIIFDESVSPVTYPQVVLMRCKSSFFSDIEHFCGLPAPTVSDRAPNDRFFAFQLGGFRWVIRIDRSEWPKALWPTPINGQPNIVGSFFDFDASPEFHEMRKWILRNHIHGNRKKREPKS